MDGVWACKVCGKPAESLCCLPACGHRFCDRCLQLWVGIYVDHYRGNWNEFPCQACWTLVKVPDRGLSEFRQDAGVNALQDQLTSLCMSPGGPGEGEGCQPCLAGQPGHSNHQLPGHVPGHVPPHQPAIHPSTSAFPQHQQMMDSSSDQRPPESGVSTSTPGGGLRPSFEMEMSSAGTPGAGGQRRLCFPSCHTYEHHMF